MDAPSPPPRLASLAARYRRWPPLARVGAYLLGCLAVSAAWCGVILGVLRPGLDVFQTPERYPLAAAAYLLGTYVTLTGGALWTWRHMQGESLRSLGLTMPHPGRSLLVGALIGVGSLGALFALEVASGLLLWDAAAWRATGAGVMVLNALTALFFGFSEELLFRGFIFQTLRRGLPTWGAMAVSAYMYAQVHFLRADLHWHTVAMPMAGLFLAGLVLAWAARRTGGIWLSAGLHAAWVYLFFLTDRQKLLVYPIQHNWLTGGGYPLAGWLGLGMIVLLGVGLRVAFGPPAAEAPPITET